MSELRIYHEANPSVLVKSFVDAEEISTVLDKVNIRFERWIADRILSKESTADDIIAAYHEPIEKLKSACGFQSLDVVHMFPDNPDKEALRKKFLREHIHTEDEIRFFIEGGGIFSLHIDDKIYAVHCEKSDLISVPAGIKHWFDAGINPRFTVIRFFTNTDGWIAQYTGSEIADLFPQKS